MSSLTTLPAEVLLMVCRYIQSDDVELRPEADRDCTWWPGYLPYEAAAASRILGDLWALSCTSKNLAMSISALLYQKPNFDYDQLRLLHFTRMFDFYEITSRTAPFFATTSVGGVRCEDLAEILMLFRLPNLETLDIHSSYKDANGNLQFDTWSSIPSNSSEFHGTSSVKTLHLSYCTAIPSALVEVLRWVARKGEGVGSLFWDSHAIVVALSNQAASLESLTLMQSDKPVPKPSVAPSSFVFERWTGDMFGLTEFHALRELQVDKQMLIGLGSGQYWGYDAFTYLPRGLRSLKLVFNYNLLSDDLEDPRNGVLAWATGILDHKYEELPHLESIGVLSSEGYWAEKSRELGIKGINHEVWDATEEDRNKQLNDMAIAFRRVGVTFTVQLDLARIFIGWDFQ